MRVTPATLDGPRGSGCRRRRPGPAACGPDAAGARGSVPPAGRRRGYLPQTDDHSTRAQEGHVIDAELSVPDYVYWCGEPEQAGPGVPLHEFYRLLPDGARCLAVLCRTHDGVVRLSAEYLPAPGWFPDETWHRIDELPWESATGSFDVVDDAGLAVRLDVPVDLPLVVRLHVREASSGEVHVIHVYPGPSVQPELLVDLDAHPLVVQEPVDEPPRRQLGLYEAQQLRAATAAVVGLLRVPTEFPEGPAERGELVLTTALRLPVSRVLELLEEPWAWMTGSGIWGATEYSVALRGGLDYVATRTRRTAASELQSQAWFAEAPPYGHARSQPATVHHRVEPDDEDSSGEPTRSRLAVTLRSDDLEVLWGARAWWRFWIERLQAIAAGDDLPPVPAGL